MKFKTTAKAVKENYKTILCIPYCQAQDLLRFHTPQAYTSGVYGWYSDIYIFPKFAISTGYNPFGKPVPYDTLREYNLKAREIAKTDYENAKEHCYNLLEELYNIVL